MVLPVMLTAMSSSDHPRRVGRRKQQHHQQQHYHHRNNNNNNNNNTHRQYLQDREEHSEDYNNSSSSGSRDQYVHASRSSAYFMDPYAEKVVPRGDRLAQCEVSDQPSYTACASVLAKGRSFPSASVLRCLTFTLLLISLLLAGHLQGTHALSCDRCDASKCANITDCPGGKVKDVCGCCDLCARVANQSCGGPWGILGTCDQDLHCFIRHPESPQLEGICKEYQEFQCNGTECPAMNQPESLCPPDSYLVSANTGTASTDYHNYNNERLLQPPPPPPPLFPPESPALSPLSSSLSSSPSLPTQAGSGHGKDDFGNTNTYASDDDEEDYNDSSSSIVGDSNNNKNNNMFNPNNLSHPSGIDSPTSDEENLEEDFFKSNPDNSDFTGNDLFREAELHGGSLDNSFGDYQGEADYLVSDMPASYCTCNMSKCLMPVCAEGFSPVIVRNGTRTPGSCCDLYECKVLDKCHSLICPVIEETPCPPDSVRPPPTWTDDHCCQVQQECTCSLKEECEPVMCPSGFQVQVISLASYQPGFCCDKFRCVNESGLTCSYDGKELQNGETWDIDKCKTCECRDGLNRCRDKSCKNPWCGWMVIPEGECCPVCKGCVSDSGQLYNESDVWREDDCTSCVCKDGQAQCQAETCAVTCSNPKYMPGQCCPVCPEENYTVSLLCSGVGRCDLACPLGFEHGEDGCPQCKCKEETCSLVCPLGFKSDVEGRQLCQCRTQPDVLAPPGCPHANELQEVEEACTKKCEYGYQRNADGCLKCKCNRCPQATCGKTCLHGYVSNDEGCQLCKCKDAPSPSLTYPPMSASSEDGKPCMSRAGALHDDGESWNDGCRVCYCHNGVEMCSLIACPAPHCSNPVFRIGDCCPTCPGLTVISPEGDQELCQSSQGRYYVEGETWALDDCTQCVCHGGAILCQTPACPPVLCHHPVRPEGSCCASCRGENLGIPAASTFPRHCKSSTGMFYKHGEIWQPTPCQSCACQNGQIQCYNQMCPPVNCNRTILKKGQCCPVCVESRRLSVCMYNGATYEEGEQWQGDNCTQCICVKGKFQCFPLACPTLHCSVMVVRKGHCCPECYDIAMLQDHKERNDKEKSFTNRTDLPASSHRDENAKSTASQVDGNIIGLSILGVLVFLLAIAVLLLVFFILRRRRHQHRSPRFRPRPKSTNLELQGHMPFITPDSLSADGRSGSGVDGSDQALHSKSVNVEKQLLEKLCSGLVSDRETRATNPYTEMVFGDQVKDPSRGSGHFLASVKT